MLREFAMTPNLFEGAFIENDQSFGVILIEILRGIADNGLLANLNKDRWGKHINEERIQSLPPRIKGKVICCLNILRDRHRLVRHPKSTKGDPQSDQEWLEVALESHFHIPFSGIILSKNLIDNSGYKDTSFVEFSESLDSKNWLGRRRTQTLNSPP